MRRNFSRSPIGEGMGVSGAPAPGETPGVVFPFKQSYCRPVNGGARSLSSRPPPDEARSGT
jgi:hypothetical protein